MHNGTIKRFLGYRRVSTGEQGTAGTSLDGQKDELATLASNIRAPIMLDFVEIESGAAEKEERRIEVARLLDAVRPGDVVAVSKFDRFTRDLEFAIRKVREILNKGARFISISEGEFDRSPEGELKLSIWASIAQMERARILDRTHGQKVRLRALGKFIEGLPPFGYVKAKGKDGHDKPRRLEIQPDEARAIVCLYELCLRGQSLGEIVAFLRANYTGRKFTQTWAWRALRNRIYTGQLATTPVRPRACAGSFQAPAQWVDAHDPIIPMEMWNRVQAALTGRRSRGARPYTDSGTAGFLLRGIATCGICGTIGRGIPTNPHRNQPTYYACRHRTHPPEGRPKCAAPYVQQVQADAEIERLTLARMADMRDVFTAPPPKPAAQVPDFDAKRSNIAARRARLVTAVATGKLRMDDIDGPIGELDAERAEVDAAAAEYAARETGDTVEGRRAALVFVDAVAGAWSELTVAERRSVLGVLVDRVVLTSERGVSVTWRDAAGLAAAVATIRPDLVARLSSLLPAPAPGASARTQNRAARRAA